MDGKKCECLKTKAHLMLQPIHQNLHNLLLWCRHGIEHLLGVLLHLHLILLLGKCWGARKHMVRLGRSVN